MKPGREEITQWLDHCDQHMREGRTTPAIKLLKRISGKKIPRPLVVRYCSLLRRANLSEASLGVLKNIVYPKLKSAEPAAPAEVLEYALALQRVGANRESKYLTSTVNAGVEPRAWLVRASQSVFEWDYASALPMYEKVLGAPWMSDYEKLICRVNYLACLGQTADPRFENAFAPLKADLEAKSLTRLLGNIMEIRAQRQIMDKNWSRAHATLQEAGRLLEHEESYGRLFVKKWSAIAKAMERNDVKFLDELRVPALKEKDWETLRHVDFYRTMIEPKGPWANWVYFGTPHPAFRAMLEKSRQFPEEEWVSRESRPGVKVDPWFVEEGEGDICHRLFVFLLRDFYRPAQTGEVASELFETRIFDLQASTKRTHKLMQRFRKWLSENKLPYRLDTSGGYSLRAVKPVELKCRRRTLPMEKNHFIFARYASAGHSVLSTQEWAEKMNISLSRAHVLIASGIEEGVLEKIHSGRYTAYRLISPD